MGADNRGVRCWPHELRSSPLPLPLPLPGLEAFDEVERRIKYEKPGGGAGADNREARGTSYELGSSPLPLPLPLPVFAAIAAAQPPSASLRALQCLELRPGELQSQLCELRCERDVGLVHDE